MDVPVTRKYQPDIITKNILDVPVKRMYHSPSVSISKNALDVLAKRK